MFSLNDSLRYSAAIIYSFIATCNKADVNPREWMVHHKTEAGHVAAIVHKTLQTPPNCAKLHRNPTETDTLLTGCFQITLSFVLANNIILSFH